MTEPLQSIPVQARVAWGEVDQLPVLAASHFLVQGAIADPANVNDLVLTMGYLLPPVLLGTPDQQRETAAALEHVTVRPVARFSIPKAKAAEMAQLILSLVNAMEGGGQQS